AVDMFAELVRQFPDSSGSLGKSHRWWLSSCAQRLANLMIARGASSESIAAVWRIQAMADTIRTGTAFPLMEAGREHAKRQAWDQAAGSFARVLDELPREFLPTSPEG